jgi:hypothetical protein
MRAFLQNCKIQSQSSREFYSLIYSMMQANYVWQT